jgi:hypothetical protein
VADKLQPCADGRRGQLSESDQKATVPASWVEDTDVFGVYESGMTV